MSLPIDNPAPELLHSAPLGRPEITVNIDPGEDLQIAGELSGDEEEDERLTNRWADQLRAALTQIAEQENITLSVVECDSSEATRTPIEPEGDVDTLEQKVGKLAQDLAPGVTVGA